MLDSYLKRINRIECNVIVVRIYSSWVSRYHTYNKVVRITERAIGKGKEETEPVDPRQNFIALFSHSIFTVCSQNTIYSDYN